MVRPSVRRTSLLHQPVATWGRLSGAVSLFESCPGPTEYVSGPVVQFLQHVHDLLRKREDVVGAVLLIRNHNFQAAKVHVMRPERRGPT